MTKKRLRVFKLTAAIGLADVGELFRETGRDLGILGVHSCVSVNNIRGKRYYLYLSDLNSIEVLP